MIVVLTKNAPLSSIGSPSIGIEPMKKCPQVRLRACGSDRYDASEWMFITMSDAWNLTFASECDAR